MADVLLIFMRGIAAVCYDCAVFQRVMNVRCGRVRICFRSDLWWCVSMV